MYGQKKTQQSRRQILSRTDQANEVTATSSSPLLSYELQNVTDKFAEQKVVFLYLFSRFTSGRLSENIGISSERRKIRKI